MKESDDTINSSHVIHITVADSIRPFPTVIISMSSVPIELPLMYQNAEPISDLLYDRAWFFELYLKQQFEKCSEFNHK
jgi:hypothetical protein